MKKNRKKADTYRFNGHPSFHAESIHSVELADLEAQVKRLEAKLADPDDTDDKKWTALWLDRCQKELAKKRAGRSLKQREKRDHRRTKRRTGTCGHAAPRGCGGHSARPTPRSRAADDGRAGR